MLNSSKEKLWNLARNSFKVFLYGSGAFFLLMLIISFTTLPFWGIYQLGIFQSNHSSKPDVIVVMGGSGMPSQTALIRTYYAAQISSKYPLVPIIIALPDNLISNNSPLKQMEKELRMRGVRSEVIFENKGTNTRGQALNIKKMLGKDKSLLIVSSPEHIYRSVQSFKKLGFSKVTSCAAFEKDLNQKLIFNSEQLGGKSYMPEIGESNQLRYQFWNHLVYEIILLREYTAILYYKMQAWI